MKTLLAITAVALLTACPSKPCKETPVSPPVAKAYDATPIDAKVERPIVRDERLTMVTDETETAYRSTPLKLDDKIGFGVFAVTRRDGAMLNPAEVTLKFLGKHEYYDLVAEVRQCLDHFGCAFRIEATERHVHHHRSGCGAGLH